MIPQHPSLGALVLTARRVLATALAVVLVVGALLVLVEPKTAAAAPAITSVSPAGGRTAGGDTITVTGSGFVAGATVTLGGLAGAVTFVNSTTLTVVTPARAPGVVDVVVTNPDTTAATSTNGFTYQLPPTVTAAAPAIGPAAGATSVTITGTNFTGATGVTFGGTAALSYSITNGTTIVATTPPRIAAGAVDVAVTNYAGMGTLTTGFTYTSSPTIAFISPASGPVTGGTAVTITGAGFVTGATVTFGGIPATTATVNSGTQVVAVTPPKAAGTADVVVRNPDGQTVSLAGGFTYQAGPGITKVSPFIGPIAGGTVVTIDGAGFAAGATVTFGGTAAVIKELTSSKIAVITPARSAGMVNVVVTNPDGLTITLVNAFTYSDAPSVSAVTPAVGPANGGTKIAITGSGFAPGATVKVGGSTAQAVVVVSATTITAATPKGDKNGAADVSVTNPDGLEGVGVALFTYEGAPEPTPAAGSTACTANPGGGKYTKGRLNFVVVQGCSDVAKAVAAVEKGSKAKAASVWYYSSPKDSWSFYLPPSKKDDPGLGTLDQLSTSIEVLIITLK